MIDRSLFTPDGSNPPIPVPVNDHCTVPTERMATLLASLVVPPDSMWPNVLEIGTGSGYQTAVLAERSKEVVSIESDPQLVEEAAKRLPGNVVLITGDGRSFDTLLVFDGILVTFATPILYYPWLKQLRKGGRLVVPEKSGSLCRVAVYERRGERFELLDVAAYAPFTEATEVR